MAVPKKKCPVCGEDFASRGLPTHVRSHDKSDSPKSSVSSNDVKLSRKVAAYLSFLKTSNGKPVSAKKIEILNEKIVAAEQSRLYLIALKHTEARNRLEAEGYSHDPTEDFIEAGLEYSDRFGISYKTWREFGVPAKVLKEAGIDK